VGHSAPTASRTGKSAAVSLKMNKPALPGTADKITFGVSHEEHFISDSWGSAFGNNCVWEVLVK
jgi:hypothetical protein